MPVAVVALAASSFAAGATAFAAAGTLAGMVAAGATMVGSALTIVGTVTGNQKLTKIGGIIGIAGGLGSMAVNAADAAASAAGDTAGSAAGDAATSAAGDAAGSAITTSPVDLGGDVTPVAGGSADAAGAGTSAAASSAVSPMNPASSGATSAASSTGTGMLDSDLSKAAAQGVSGSSNDLLTQSLSDPNATFNPANMSGAPANAFDSSGTTVGQSLNMNPYKPPTGMLDSIESYPGAVDAAANAPAGINSPIAVNPAAAGQSSGGIGATMDQLQSWAKDNPVLAQAALKGGASLLTNLVPSARDKAMMQQYAAQTALQQQQTNLLKTRQLWGSGHIK